VFWEINHPWCLTDDPTQDPLNLQKCLTDRCFVIGLALQCDDVGEGSQTEADKARVCGKYTESELYIVSQRVTASQQMDLTLADGCIVAVIKQSDPMGNCDRWFVDNGGLHLDSFAVIIIFILADISVFAVDTIPCCNLSILGVTLISTVQSSLIVWFVPSEACLCGATGTIAIRAAWLR